MALLVLPDSILWPHRLEIVRLARTARLRDIYAYKDCAESGGLMAYGSDLVDLARRAASFVDKILRGANASEIPVERPVKLELSLNLRTAKALNLSLPQSLLLRADHIIQ